jgi:Tol biopolymer transport system component
MLRTLRSVSKRDRRAGGWGANVRRLMLAVAVVSALMASVLATPASATYAGRDGRLAFVRGQQIFTVAPSGGTATKLTRDGKNFRPKWSPDGKRIAFIHQTPAGSRDIWVMSATGSNKTRVTRLGNVTAEATWSPNGKTLAFAAGDNPEFGQLSTIRSTAPFGTPTAIQGYLRDCTDCDNGSTDLAPIYVDQFVAWSPDGTTIAVFNHDDGRFDDAIYKYDVATRESHRYAATGDDLFGYIDFSDLAWGPHGDFGYGAAATGEFDGADPFVKLVYPGFAPVEGDRSPAPSPLGTRLAFVNSTSSVPNIYVATASGGNRRVVTRGHQPDWQPLP